MSTTVTTRKPRFVAIADGIMPGYTNDWDDLETYLANFGTTRNTLLYALDERTDAYVFLTTLAPGAPLPPTPPNHTG
jgi:hypothetical protein